MSDQKYIVIGIRKNVDNKTDYIWVSKYTNNSVIKYSETGADSKIESIQKNSSFQIYNLQKILVN